MCVILDKGQAKSMRRDPHSSSTRNISHTVGVTVSLEITVDMLFGLVVFLDCCFNKVFTCSRRFRYHTSMDIRKL